MAGKEANLGTALINYAAKDAGFSSTSKRVNKQLTGFEKKAGKAKRAAKSLNAAIGRLSVAHTALASAALSALSGAGIGAFIKTQGEMATKMEQFARITGLTITEMQVFQKGMGEFAISTNTTNKALQTFAKATGEAKNGLASYARAFESLGISVEELEGKSMQELLNAVARGLKEIEDPAVRTSAAMLLFGGRGTEVAAALQKVNFENAEYVKSITDTGIVTEKQSKTLHGVTAAYDTLGDTLTTQKQILAAELAPEWSEMLGKFNELAPFIFKVITPAFKGLVDVVTTTADAIVKVAIGVEKVVKEVAQLDKYTPDVKASGAQRFYEDLVAEGQARNLQPGTDAYRIQQERERAAKDALDRFRRLAAQERGMAGRATRDIPLSPMHPEFGISNAVRKSEKEAKDAGGKWAQSYVVGLRFGFAQNESAIRAELEKAAVEAERVAADSAWNAETERFARANRAGRFNAALNERTPLDEAIMNAERGNRAVLKDSTDAVQRITDANKKWYDGLVDVQMVVDHLDNNLTDTFYNAVTGAESLSDSFRNLLGDITKMIAKQIIYNKLVSPIVSGVSGLPFFGGKAEGGPVLGGGAYLVGEQGPEIFVPNVSGNIVPNHAMGGGVNLVQNMEFKLFDDTSFNERMIPIGAAIKEETMKGVFDALDSPGAEAT